MEFTQKSIIKNAEGNTSNPLFLTPQGEEVYTVEDGIEKSEELLQVQKANSARGVRKVKNNQLEPRNGGYGYKSSKTWHVASPKHFFINRFEKETIEEEAVTKIVTRSAKDENGKVLKDENGNKIKEEVEEVVKEATTYERYKVIVDERAINTKDLGRSYLNTLTAYVFEVRDKKLKFIGFENVKEEDFTNGYHGILNHEIIMKMNAEVNKHNNNLVDMKEENIELI